MKPSLASKVETLERKYAKLKALTGEMIATLTIEENQEYFPSKLIDLAEMWEPRFRKITGSVRHPDGLHDNPRWI